MASFITHQIDAANRSTYTFSGISFPAGRVAVFVRVQAGVGVSLDSVTINGVTATEDLDGSFSSNNPGKWFSAIVASGTGSVVVAMTGGSGNRAAVAVHNVVGLNYATGAVDDTGNPSIVDTNTEAGDVALCCSYVFGAGVTYTGNANLPNERFDGQIEGSNYHAVHDNLNCSAGTPTQFRVTASSGSPRSVLAIYRAPSAAGSSAGAATASAAGAALRAAPGSSSGSATAAATGAAISAAVGSAAGIATALASADSATSATGSSAGAATANATGRATAAASGSSAGSGAASGTGAATTAAAASSSGAAAANANGAAIAATAGSAAGSATASAIPGGGGNGQASGTSVAAAVGASIVASAGTAAGAGSVSATGRAITGAAGATAGQGVASAAGSAIVAAFSISGGAAAVLGGGGAIAAVAGASVGVSVATGVGIDAAAIVIGLFPANSPHRARVIGGTLSAAVPSGPVRAKVIGGLN